MRVKHPWGDAVQFSSVSQSCLTLQPRELQHARPPCLSQTPGVYSNSCPLSQWCHPAISSSVVPFSSRPQSLPASGSFPMSQLSAWGGQSTGVSASASVLPMNTQDWSPLGWTGWISLQSRGLSRVFSNTTGQKHQFFGTQLSPQSNSHIHTWPLEISALLKRDTRELALSLRHMSDAMRRWFANQEEGLHQKSIMLALSSRTSQSPELQVINFSHLSHPAYDFVI